MADRYSRQESFISNLDLKQKKVCVIGIGAIGSKVAELCTRVGIGKLYLFDDDVVELHNLTGQIYTERDVGTPKVIALQRYLSQINSDITIYAEPTRIIDENQLPKDLDYVFSCVDLFKARLKIIDYQKRINPKCIIIDGGTSDESPTIGTIQMYNRQKGHITELKDFMGNLKDKIKTEEVVSCTEKIIPSLITTSEIIAALEVHWMLQNIKDGRIYEEMMQITLGKKPSINWFGKSVKK